MHLIGSLFVFAGALLLVLGAVFFLIAAFRESVLWGLGVLLLPFVSLAFLIVHWRSAKDAFFLQLYGVAALLLAQIVFHTHLPGML